MKLEFAPDIKFFLKKILKKKLFNYVILPQITCFRSSGAKTRAIARIWGYPKIWQLALGQPPHYCLEVLTEKFDRLTEVDKIKVLIHELMHIPKNFSGALLPHRHHSQQINRREVDKLYDSYLSR